MINEETALPFTVKISLLLEETSFPVRKELRKISPAEDVTNNILVRNPKHTKKVRASLSERKKKKVNKTNLF